MTANTSCRLLKTGINHTYRIDNENETFIFRVYSYNWRTKDEITEELNGFDLTDSIKFGFGAGISKFDFNFNNEKDRLEVDFSLIAFVLIYWIDKLMKKVKEEEEAIRQASFVGDT